MDYRFSVGKLVLAQGSTDIKTIHFAKNINVSYKVNTHKEYGPEGQVTSEVIENEEITLTCEFVEAEWDYAIEVGTKYDVVLIPGDNNTGISLTLANCMITEYSLKSAQAEFVMGTLSFSKMGKLQETGAVTKQVITFGDGSSDDVSLGDSATLDVSYDGNTITHIIPTALGIITRSTEFMGGGQLSIQVKAYVEKTTRLEVEAYLIGLYAQLQPGVGTLTVTYGGDSYTVTGCVWAKGSAMGAAAKYGSFTLDFIKSAY